MSYSRQNLQSEYVNRLSAILKGKDYSHASKAVAFNEINSIKTKIGRAYSPNKSTRSHRSYLKYLIEQNLDED